MARKKKSAEVSENEVSQVENGSVEETQTEVVVEQPVEETKSEEKEEVSETEKVNEEINEISEDAEAEVESVNEEEALNEATSEVEVGEEEVKKPNEKFFTFDKKEARRFYVDRERFLSVIFYKRIVVGIRGDKTDSIESLVDFGALVYNNVEALIKSLRFEDVQYYAMNIDENKHRDGYDVGVISIDVPFTSKTNLFITKIRGLINENYPECYVRSSTNCRTDIDTTKSGEKSILKGFASFASYTRFNDDVLKVTARSAGFIKQSLGFDERDINDLNRYILSNNKINVVGEGGVIHTFRSGEVSTEQFMSYYQTIRGRLCGMIYEITDKKDNSYQVSRIQYYIRIRTRKTFETIVPIGIKIATSVMDPVWIEDLKDIFTWTDVENKVGFLGNKDIVGTEPNVQNLMDDINQIQVNLMDPIEKKENEKTA